MPPIPAYLISSIEANGSLKASVSQPLPVVPVVNKIYDDMADVGEPNQDQIGAAEFKVNAANIAIKTPSRVQHTGPDEYYEVKVTTLFLSPANGQVPPL